MAGRKTTTYGFSSASKLLQGRIRQAAEGRGFAQTRVLTHWEEIAGADLAGIARPVEVSYSKGGFGGTLTLLTTGARAPMVEMRKEEIRARINAVYGYNAIARIKITQTAPTGFAEGQAQFTYGEPAKTPPPPDPKIAAAAQSYAENVTDEGLRGALEALARNVLSKAKT